MADRVQEILSWYSSDNAGTKAGLAEKESIHANWAGDYLLDKVVDRFIVDPLIECVGSVFSGRKRHIKCLNPSAPLNLVYPVFYQDKKVAIPVPDSRAKTHACDFVRHNGWAGEIEEIPCDAIGHNFAKICNENGIGICITKYSKCMLDKLREERVLDCGFLTTGTGSNRRSILRWQEAQLNSPSYEQESQSDFEPWNIREDYALLIRSRNPFNMRTGIFLFLGIRGLGSYGAARHLFHFPNELAEEFGEDDFACVVKVQGNDSNIISTELTKHKKRLRWPEGGI